MKANELRIGNIVLNDRVENIIVAIAEPLNIVGLRTPQGNLINADIELIKPIPLTEEWLLKFGFELLTDKKEGYKNTSYSHGKIPILLYWDGSRLSTTFWQGNEMRFVHQLQNLIFALTGTELTIK
jgi:hypothetical protein